MFKKILLILLLITVFLLTNSSNVLADHIGAGDICDPSDPGNHCINGYSCQPSKTDPSVSLCQESKATDIFGKIKPPDALKPLVDKDPSGAGGLSTIFSNFIRLIYVISAVVLVLMLVWGGYDWIVSEGEKEKLKGAQDKILNAIVGIIILAAAFAVIQLLGTFTGFKFFEGQKP